MNRQQQASVDRRQFSAAAPLTVLGMTGAALAQSKQQRAEGEGQRQGRARPNAVRVSQGIADFVTGFDLKTVPQPVIDRARAVFIDTVGVMLAGSHEEVRPPRSWRW